jgi:hypothetical protein
VLHEELQKKCGSWLLVKHANEDELCMRITRNKSVRAGGGEGGALLVLHTVAIVADNNVIERPAVAEARNSLCAKCWQNCWLPGILGICLIEPGMRGT